jgi:hypothetical protein
VTLFWGFPQRLDMTDQPLQQEVVMSQFAHASAQRLRSHRTVVPAALVALAATVAIVLVIAIGSDSSDDPASAVTPASVQSSHPEETDVAAGITRGIQPAAADRRPDESEVGRAIELRRTAPRPCPSSRSRSG